MENGNKELNSLLNKIEIDQIFRQDVAASELENKKMNFDLNKTNTDIFKLKNGKTIKDFNLFWIAISAVTSISKEDEILKKDKKEINDILIDVLDFYSNYIFKNRFNLMKLTSMMNEVYII